MSLPKMPPVYVPLVAMLLTACNLLAKPLENSYAGVPSRVESVSTSAYPQGVIHISISYVRTKEDTVTLSCTYPGEDGSYRPYSYVDSLPAKQDFEIRNDSLDFVVKAPGEYQVTCKIGEGEKSTSFTIEALPDSATPTITPLPVQPASEGPFQMPTLGQFTSGGMWFYFDQATTSVPAYFLLHCLPGVNYADEGGSDYFQVAADGTLTGECSLAYGDYATYTGKLTQGQWSADGQVSFKLETSIVSSSKGGSSHNDIVWIGTGQFTGATSATGTATWSGVCQTSSYDQVPCGKAEYGSYVEASGTIPWIINFYP